LESDTTVKIPFDDSTEVFYINLYKDGITIDKTQHGKKLSLAKIVVPKPGVTQYVQNDRDESWNAYIVNLREYKLYGDAYGKFEEDTIELLRDNISPILADNLIGNIRLSEDLKITNTAGTLELNSDSLKLYDENNNLLAKFNEKGVYFYNTDGIELARFTNIDARIGNILITTDGVQSNDYISDSRGFKITDSGFAEFEDVKIRGRISSSVFEYDKISSVSGKLLVSNASVLSQDVSSCDTTITVEDPVFSVGEVLRIREGTNEEYMLITDDSNASTYTVTRFLNGSTGESNPSWYKGTAIVSTGIGTDGSQTGYIMLDAVSYYSPFIDIVYRNSTVYDDFTTKVRLGNLEGIVDSDFGVLDGFGLYSDNVFLKGKLYAPEIKTGISGSRIELSEEGLFLYDSSDDKRFSVLLNSISGFGDVGDIIIGDINSDNYIKWDDSLGTLTIRGSLSADDLTTGSITADKLDVSVLSAISADLGTITAGTVTGATLQTALSGARVVMDTNNFIAYDDASGTGNEVFKIVLTGDDVGDVIIGDYSNSKGIKWDKSEATFNIKGAITATSGDFTGTVNVGSAGKVYIDGANEVIKVYDESNNLRVELGKLS